MDKSSVPTSWIDTYLWPLCFLLSTAASLYLAFAYLDVTEAENAFISFGYANIALLCALFAWVCIPEKSSDLIPHKIEKRTLLLTLICFAATLFLYSREGGGFKISFDEEVLSNVALNMYRDHLPVMRESTLQNTASFEMIDKRPTLFPFLLSLVHTICGYRVANAFYLNFALTFSFLFLLGNIVKRVGGNIAAYFSIGLACSTPIIAQNASGGGFDMLNATLALLVTWLAMNFWQTPSLGSLSRLVFATALASHVRYESSLIAIPVVILILCRWIRDKRIDCSPTLLAIPLTYIPLVWQFRAIDSASENFQYKTDGSGSFSLDYLSSNLESAYRFFFVPDLNYAGSPFVSFLGLGGLLAILSYWALHQKKKKLASPARAAAFTMGLFPVLHFALILVFYFGQLDNPIVSRLGLPVVTLFLITGGILLAFICKRGRAPRLFVGLTFLCTALYASKMYSTHRYSSNSEIAKRSEWILERANALPTGNYLFITAMPRIFEIQGYNNIVTPRARKRLSEIKRHMDLLTYDEVFVIQNGKIELGDDGIEKSLLPFNSLGPAVSLEPIDEVSFTPYNYTQFSRVASIDISLDVAPEKEQSTGIETGQSLRLTPEQLASWKKTLP